MRFCLFDWTARGHHPYHLGRYAEALFPLGDVVVAAPDATLREIPDLRAATLSLGAARPLPLEMPEPGAVGLPDPEDNATLAETELDLLERVIEEARPDHVLHLWADPVLRWIVRRPALKAPVTLAITNPRLHFHRAYGSRLTPEEWARARLHDWLVARWRRRPEAHAILAYQEDAVRRWESRPGAPAYLVPEPSTPVPSVAPSDDQRSGCALAGGMTARKGVDRMARAVASKPGSLRVTLAGQVPSGYRAELARHVTAMQASGATVEVYTRALSEAELVGHLASARCALLPYRRQLGHSRILFSAAAVGTPVVADSFGWLGHTVRTRGLGLTVDCDDARALRRAISFFTDDPGSAAEYRPRLRRFAQSTAPACLAQALRPVFWAASPSLRS